MLRGRDEGNQAYPFRPASGDLSRPEPPGAFPNLDVPGHGMHMRPNVYAPSQQPRAQVSHSKHGPGPLPPRDIPVQPTLPSDYARIPRAFVVPHQQGPGYVDTEVNSHSRPPFRFPETVPQAHSHARAPDSAQTPPYGRNSFTNPGRSGDPEPLPYSLAPVPSQSLTPKLGLQPYGRPSSGGSYEVVNPHVIERPHPPQIPNPHAGHSFTPERPQQLYDVGRYQAHQPHAQASQHYPPRAGQKKALLVGIDYSRHRDRELRLKHGVRDAKEIARFLEEQLYFYPNNIRILTDDQRDQYRNLPTEANILDGMHWLVEDAQSGDSLFFYFSGHAA